MPFGVEPQCNVCKTTTSSMWRKDGDNEVICNSCSLRSSIINNNASTSNVCPFNLRKSTRVKSSKLKLLIQNKIGSSKGKNKRTAVKKPNIKIPTAISPLTAHESLYHDGIYIRIGDIVSTLDFKERVYYCQIRGLFKDEFFEKLAVITWLIPTKQSPKDGFDPSTFIVGPDEDIPRKLEHFEFVCRPPSEYYHAKKQSGPFMSEKSECGLTWTNSGPKIVPLSAEEELTEA